MSFPDSPILGDCGLLCNLNSLKGLRKVTDFQFVQLFSSYKDESDDFQALYMLELKQEVLPLFLKDMCTGYKSPC